MSESCPDPVRKGTVVEEPLRIWSERSILAGAQDLERLAPSLVLSLQAQVSRDSGEPCSDGVRLAEVSDTLQRHEEHVVYDVVGLWPGSEQGPAHRMDARSMALQKERNSRDLTRLRTLDKIAVG
jgi:hypothetical protein